MTKDIETLLLVDLSGIYWTSWHVGGAAEPADAPARRTYQRIRRYAEQYQHIAICADHEGKNWRHEVYPEYKSNRDAHPEAGIAQLRNCIAELKSDGFPIWSADGFEADDIIAHAAGMARDAGRNVLVLSQDKDLHQLVVDQAPSIAILNPAKDKNGVSDRILREAEVIAKFGVHPNQLGDWLAIAGDASDNIPHIKGLGEEAATALLKKYTDILGIIDAAKTAKSPMTANLRTKLLEGQSVLSKARILVAFRDPPEGTVKLQEAFSPRVPQRARAQSYADALPENDDDLYEPPEAEAELVTPAKTEPAPPPVIAPTPKQPVATETPLSTSFQPPSRAAVAELREADIPIRPEPETPKPPEPKEAPKEAPKEVKIERAANNNQMSMIALPPPSWEYGLEPANWSEAWSVSQRLFNSRVFPQFENVEAVFAVHLLARSHGIHAIKMLMPGMTYVMRGRLGMHAMLIVGLIVRSKVCEYFEMEESTATRATYATKRVGGRREQKLSYTIEEATAAGLLAPTHKGEPSQYVKRPATMLRHRCEVELGRMVYPDVVGGLVTDDELEEINGER